MTFREVCDMEEPAARPDEGLSIAPADDEGSPKTGAQFIEVRRSDGRTLTYKDAGAARDDILCSVIAGTDEARDARVDDKGNTVGKWTTVEALCARYPVLRGLYRPVWDCVLTGLTYGALVGMILKAVDTAILLFAVNPSLGLAFVACVAAFIFSRNGLIALIITLFVSARLGVPPPFMTLIGTGLVGGLFGGMAGMVIGTGVGALRARNCRRAPDAKPEGARPYVLGAALPGAFLAAAVPAWIWLSFDMAQKLFR
jgi:hypothetical protein